VVSPKEQLTDGKNGNDNGYSDKLPPWFKPRRSVETDYKFYDPPEAIWRKINQRRWKYKTRRLHYQLRDLALMSLLYLTCARVGEIVRADVVGGYSPSVHKHQFVDGGDVLKLRELIVIKREAESMEDYPVRREIPLSRIGYLARFTRVIEDYLDMLDYNDELFKFKPKRAWQIVNHVTGEMPHYLRDMGLKFYSRLFERNLKDLQDFSGHARVENLMKYLAEGDLETRVKEYRG